MRTLNKKPVKTREEVATITDQAALLSGISSKTKRINIFRINTTVETAELKELLEKELMLLHAEEWLHVLKDLINGDPLSSHSLDIYSHRQDKDFYPHEIEVADYFLDKGIPYSVLDSTRWFERYERKNVLAEILGN